MVGSGAMGAALGASWIAGGSRVLTCLAGRSPRSHDLARTAGIEVIAALDDVMGSDLVVSVVPPGQALAVARDVAAAAGRAGAHPLVADLNAVAPDTVAQIAAVLGAQQLELVDGSISGGPPTAQRHPRLYLSGPAADQVAAIPSPWVEIVRLDGDVGVASALKMCTASMYKCTTALILQAMLTAQHHGVLQLFLDDTARAWPDRVPHWHRDVALAATKAGRFVEEMRQIAITQVGAGQERQLFSGVAAAYARVSRSPLGRSAPESVDPDVSVDSVLAGLVTTTTDLPRAVLLDFSDTLFHNESAEQALLAALGPEHVHRADELRRVGGLNGSRRPDDVPAALSDAWDRRDLDPAAHRRAYAGSSRLAGLSDEQAEALYDRGISAEAWHPYPDTIRVLRVLHAAGVGVAVVSNIGWDPRPVLNRYGVTDDVDVLVLSDERGVLKPDREIFRIACAELGVAATEALMVGDHATNDGAAVELGLGFALVDPDPVRRRPDALLRAVGLASPAAHPIGNVSTGL